MYAVTELSKKVQNWISENEVKAVQIGLHGKLPADAFFRLEKILTKNKISYTLFAGGVGGEGELRLLESDGSLRVLVPEKSSSF